MSIPTYEQVGARIRRLRLLRELSQVEFAARMGVTQPTVSNWESGAKLDHVLLAEIAEELGSSLAELLAPPTEENGASAP